MSYNDEFESLIKNFKLDEDGPPPARTQERAAPPRRQPPPQRTAAPEPRRAPPPDRRPPEQRPAQDRRIPDQRAAQARRPEMPPQRPAAGARRENFQVRIDDSKFYTQGGIPPRPPKDGGPPPPDDDDDDEIPEGRFSGLGRWTKALLVLVIVLGISAFLAIFALASASDLFGLNKPDQELLFTLPDELSVSEVASLLKEKGVITQPLTFQLYCTLKKKAEDGFIPGTYDLNSNMSYDQIIQQLSTVKITRVEKQLTFYEGMTMREIAALLEKENICEADDFFAFLSQDELPWGFDFLSGIPDTAERYRRLEGYLFPDTYTFTEGESVDTVVQKFLVNFNNKFDEDLLKKITDQGMTVDQVVTLASIIQKEVSSDEDMKMVSSVFHNRLTSGQITKPQSDVTVFYVENDLKPFLGSEQGKITPGDPNQHIYDAYNTYACDGLPVGPICNPGMNAINAALEPAASQYYFFVADKDGVTYYAATQAEHDANVAKVLEMGDAHGVGTGIGPQEESGGAESEAQQ